MLNAQPEPPKRFPNSPDSPSDAADAADAISAEIALLQAHDETEERRLLRYIGKMEPVQIP